MQNRAGEIVQYLQPDGSFDVMPPPPAPENASEPGAGLAWFLAALAMTVSGLLFLAERGVI